MARIHIVQRLDRQPFRPSFERPPEPEFGTPVCAFRDRGSAEEFRAEVEYAERLKENPFTYSGWGLMSLNEQTVANIFHDVGVRQPSTGLPQDGDWARWWHECAGEFTPRDAMAVWEALDGGDFYEIVEVEFEDEA